MTRKHWTDSIKAENVALRAQLNEARQQPMFEAFARAVADSIMVQLAVMPFDKWPDVAKRAFEHESRRASTIAYLYKARLP